MVDAPTSIEAPMDPSTLKLKTFENAAAGHDGILEDESGEIFVKPCTQAEIDFYQASVAEHPDFYEFMPTFVGTLQLGAPASVDTSSITSEADKEKTLLHGRALATETALVLENLEHGFTRPNVIDLKLGAKLYAEDTKAEKAARLDKVSAETTSGSLHFRITGMKVWNGTSYDIYDKFYGRAFDANNVGDGFATFFKNLASSEVIEVILNEVREARRALEGAESRMFGTSVLILYEGDKDVLQRVLKDTAAKAKQFLEKDSSSRKTRAGEGEDDDDENDDYEDDDEDEEGGPVTHRVKIIDFAHSSWTPGKGPDENVITGLKNIETQLDRLIAR